MRAAALVAVLLGVVGIVQGGACVDDVVPVSERVALAWCGERAVRVVRGRDAAALQAAVARESLVVLPGFGAGAAGAGRAERVERGGAVAAWKKGALEVRLGSGELLEFYEASSGRLLTREVSHEVSGGVVSGAWSLAEGEAVFGGGQYVNGLLNYRAAPVQMVQFNLEAVVPFLLSSNGWGLLWDNYAQTLLNPPERSLGAPEGSSGALGTLTVEADGALYFLVELCDPHSNYGCDARGRDVALLATGSDGVKRKVCGHGASNLPNALTCRLDGLSKGQRLALELSSNMTGVKVSVSSGASYDRLALRSEHSRAADYYVFAADDSEATLDSVIAGYRRATGVAYQYARWVFGFWQCREHYATQAELLEAATLMRAHKVPVDAIVQDWQYWGELGWAPQWDRKIYPDPAAMVEELRRQNLHLMVSVWSKFQEGTHFYDELVANGFQVPGTNWLDPWNPEARRQFYEWADEAHFRIGIDSLWLDATEPEDNVQRGKRVFGNQSAEELLNTYSLMVAKAVYEGLVRRDARRVFSLTRSSFAGQQRYGATIWSGDTLGAWDTLPRQVAMSVNYQLSGIPYWSMDIGGFFRPQDQYASADYHALLTRWFQFGTFVPVMRVHGAGTHTELWHFGNDTMKRIVESAIDLRYRLLDYVYSGYREVEARHYTMQRGLVLDFFHDPEVLNIADQFMFGPLLMVAPVTTRDPQRRVYLPAPFGKSGGGYWRDFYTGQKLEAGWHEERNISLDRIPLYVRSGILVLSPKVQHSAERAAGAPLEVRVYAGRDAKFSLFEDDGADADVGRAMSWIDFEWSDQTRALTVADRRGTLAEGVPKERRLEIVLVRPGLGVGVQRNAAPDMVLSYKGTHMLARLPKPPVVVEEIQFRGNDGDGADLHLTNHD